MLLGIRGLEESSTYQGILEEGEAIGEVREARKLILHLGTQRFGAADGTTVEAIESLDTIGSLDRIVDRLLTASSWQNLLSGVER